MTLDEATKTFEARFEKIIEWDPKQSHPGRVPGHGAPYIVLCSAGIKPEGEPTEGFASPERAVEMWAETSQRYTDTQRPAKTLFWRKRPEMMEGRSRWRFYVYARLACL